MATIKQLIEKHREQQAAEDAQNLRQATTRITLALDKMGVDRDQYLIVAKNGLYYAEFELDGWTAYFAGFYGSVTGYIVDANGERGKSQSWDDVDKFDIAAAIEYLKREYLRNKERWDVVVVTNADVAAFNSELEERCNSGYEFVGSISTCADSQLEGIVIYTAVMKKRL